MAEGNWRGRIRKRQSTTRSLRLDKRSRNCARDGQEPKGMRPNAESAVEWPRSANPPGELGVAGYLEQPLEKRKPEKEGGKTSPSWSESPETEHKWASPEGVTGGGSRTGRRSACRLGSSGYCSCGVRGTPQRWQPDKWRPKGNPWG